MDTRLQPVSLMNDISFLFYLSFVNVCYVGELGLVCIAPPPFVMESGRSKLEVMRDAGWVKTGVQLLRKFCGVSCSDHHFCLPVCDVTATQIIDLRLRDGVYVCN